MKPPRHIRRKLKEHEKLDLPVPRLEIRKHIIEDSRDGWTVRADYSMVYEHLMGEHISVPLGQTKIGANLERYDFMDLPFRDGAHLINEMVFLRLRGFVVYGNEYQEIFANDQTIPGGTRQKLKNLK